MRKNGKTIMDKIQDVMGIKSGKYCSSDVSVVSLKGNNNSAEASAFMGEDKEPSVTYTSCPSKELKTIYLKDIIMNKNIIPDCVLGGSVTLNDLGGYVVNYGDTICPAPTVKGIQRCGGVKRPISIDFGNNVVTDGLVYNLSFNGASQPAGCYTIIGDTPFNSEGSVSSVQQVPDCRSCTPTPTLTPPPRTYTEIQSCRGGTTYSVEGLFGEAGKVYNLTFEGGMIDGGCYTILGPTTNAVEGSVLTSVGYDDCMSCLNPTPTPTITPTPK